ncbi:MAG: hypothetical protein GY858_06105 [Candidatus Omnitrophica bacterium]|nr:hypothetical protein [Candidatus Omnitrophota bacterium]
MMVFFSKNKANYRKGQIFPFLLALVVVIMIMLMITVNLGRIGVFKTDVSNAADAGALAGASVLSATLLEMGLKNDSIFGYALTMFGCIIVAIIAFMYVAAIACAISLLITMWSEYFIVKGAGVVGWGNAKKTAIQYAFQNAGIDEPRPSFKHFLVKGCGFSEAEVTELPPNTISDRYDEYMNQKSRRSRDHGRSGFGRFLADDENGFWRHTIAPGDRPPHKVHAEYAWNKDGTNCWDDGICNNQPFDSCPTRDRTADSSDNSISPESASDCMDNYDYSVKVEVSGVKMYGIKMWSFLEGAELVTCMINYVLGKINWPSWLEWLGSILKFIMSIFGWFLNKLVATISPSGFRLMGGDIVQTAKSPLTVTVIKRTRGGNVGFWNFVYGNSDNEVRARSSAVAGWNENPNNPGFDFEGCGCRSIIPTGGYTNCKGGDLKVTGLCNILVGLLKGDADWQYMNTKYHLFETRLTAAQ